MRKILALVIVVLGVLAGSPGASAATTCGAPLSTPQTLGAVVVAGELVVPSGTSCELEGTQVTGKVTVEAGAVFAATAGASIAGNVDAGSNAQLTVTNSTINGNVRCNGCEFEDVIESMVRGRVEIMGATQGDFIEDNELGGLIITDSSAGAFAFVIADNTIHGRAVLERNTGPMLVAGNTFGGGLLLAGNSVTGFYDNPDDNAAPFENLLIDENRIGGAFELLGTIGPSVLSENTATGVLRCEGNLPAPTAPSAGSNVAPAKLGQCATL